jgi:hypothetical protein
VKEDGGLLELAECGTMCAGDTEIEQGFREMVLVDERRMARELLTRES